MPRDSSGAKNAWGLYARQVAVLKFLYGQPAQTALYIEIGEAVQPERAERVSGSLKGLLRQGLVRKLSRGVYGLTSTGERIWGEILSAESE